MVNISEERYNELLAKEKELEERKRRGSGRATHLNASLSSDERKARAKKAVEARWAKYRANR